VIYPRDEPWTRTVWRGFFAPIAILFLPLALLGCRAKPAEQPDPKEELKSKEPTAEVIAAWRKAGGQYGGMKLNHFGEPRHLQRVAPGDAEPGEGLKDDEVPGFYFPESPMQSLAKLPAVGVPFGLILQTATDADLKGLAGVEHLQALCCRGKEVTDEGMKTLAAHRDLRWLQVGEWGRVTDDGLKTLAGLPRLEAVYLWSAKVSDRGLKHLAGLKRLRWLATMGATITDAGVKDIVAHKDLESLNLGGTKVTDACLKNLVELTKLTTLDLSFTPVTDASFKGLATMKQLRWLYLPERPMTPKGVEELRKALPKTEVELR
jgi:Leucine-rich repeat (LRR) protein